MIGYVTLGTNDLTRGARFYDAIAKEVGIERMMETERYIAWGTPRGGAGSARRRDQPASLGRAARDLDFASAAK